MVRGPASAAPPPWLGRACVCRRGGFSRWTAFCEFCPRTRFFDAATGAPSAVPPAVGPHVGAGAVSPTPAPARSRMASRPLWSWPLSPRPWWTRRQRVPPRQPRQAPVQTPSVVRRAHGLAVAAALGSRHRHGPTRWGGRRRGRTNARGRMPWLVSAGAKIGLRRSHHRPLDGESMCQMRRAAEALATKEEYIEEWSEAQQPANRHACWQRDHRSAPSGCFRAGQRSDKTRGCCRKQPRGWISCLFVAVSASIRKPSLAKQATAHRGGMQNDPASTVWVPRACTSAQCEE